MLHSVVLYFTLGAVGALLAPLDASIRQMLYSVQARVQRNVTY